MAGMYGSFGDIKKAVGVVMVLLVAAFILGIVVGYKAGSPPSGAPSPTSQTDIERRADEIIEEAQRKSNMNNSGSLSGNNGSGNTQTNTSDLEAAEREMQKMVEEYNKKPSQENKAKEKQSH